MFIVTGGAGFIGSNIVHALYRRRKTEVAVIDYLGEDAKWQNLKRVGISQFIFPDETPHFLEEYAGEIEGIFHLGAISTTTEKDADLIVSQNFQLSQTLWNWCAQNKKPFLYASSASTYGDGKLGYDDVMTQEALDKLVPLNPYGWSKHLFDSWVEAQIRHNRPTPPQWAGLKFFNVYGPNEYHKGSQRSVTLQVIEEIRQGAHARLFKSYRPSIEDGGQKRDFVWVGDCVNVMLWLLDNPNISGLFNLGTGEARTFNELAHAAFVAFSLKADIRYIEMPDGLDKQYQYFTQANMTKLRQAGYTAPFTSIEEGTKLYATYLTRDDIYL